MLEFLAGFVYGIVLFNLVAFVVLGITAVYFWISDQLALRALDNGKPADVIPLRRH